jgi:hypothetical protein
MCQDFRRVFVGFLVEGFQPVGILTFGLGVPVLLEADWSVFFVAGFFRSGLAAFCAVGFLAVVLRC